MSINLTAVVFGATGATGTALVNNLLQSSFQRVISIGRRAVNRKWLPSDASKLEQLVVDMGNLSESNEVKDACRGELTTVFWCLGTTRKAAGSAEEFKKVELVWLKEVLAICKKGGVGHFSLLTSMGANHNSMTSDWAPLTFLLYIKTKGLAEEAVKESCFPIASIFRPGGLVRGDKSNRPSPWLESCIIDCLPSSFSIAVEDLAAVIVLDAEAAREGKRQENPIATWEHKAIKESARTQRAPC